MYLGDFHIHSNFSDGKLSIPEIIDIYGSRGFGVIAITDHVCDPKAILGKSSAYLGCSLTEATFPLYREILRTEAQRAWETYGMRVIPGLELTKNSVSNHRSAHVLALGVSDIIYPEGDPVEWVERIHSLGGLAIAAHPVWTRRAEKQTFHLWDRREQLADIFDAWEVASGPHLFEEVKASGLPLIASSDFHKRSHLTSWKTTFSCDNSTEAILAAIKNQHIGFQFYEERATVIHGNSIFDRGLGNRHWRYALGNLVRA